MISRTAIIALALLLGGCGGLKDLNPLLSSGGIQDSSRFGFESGTPQGWAASASQGGTSVDQVFPTDQVSFFGTRSLGFHCLNMDSFNKAVFSIAYASGGEPSLSGAKVTLWLYTPAEIAPSKDQPSYAQIFMMALAGNKYANGPSANLAQGGWTKLEFSPVANPGVAALSFGGNYIDAGFDPAAIKEVGVKLNLAGSAGTYAFNGNVFLDGVNW